MKRKIRKIRKIRRFKVLPGTEITFGFDFTGMILNQFGIDWIADPHIDCCYILCQPYEDINGKRCAEKGSVSIDRKYLLEVDPIEINYE